MWCQINVQNVLCYCTLLFNCLQDVVTLQFNGKKLDKKDFFGKSDPFLVFYRCNEDNRFVRRQLNMFIFSMVEVIDNSLTNVISNYFVISFFSFTACHRTEVIKNTLNPTWKRFTLHARALCNGDYDR